VGPFHRLQLFTNCPSVGPSHGVPSFRNRLLQRVSPTGSQALPANLLQCGLLSPWVHRSCQEPAPAWGSPRGHSLLQASTCSGVGSLPQATGGDLLHRGPPWAAGEQRASPWSSSQVAREGSLLRHFGHLLSPPSSLTLVSEELFLSHHLTPLSKCRLSCRDFFLLPLLKYVTTEALPPLVIGLALGSGGSILEPAGAGFIRHGDSVSQLVTEATPIDPCYQNLATQTHNIPKMGQGWLRYQTPNEQDRERLK